MAIAGVHGWATHRVPQCIAIHYRLDFRFARLAQDIDAVDMNPIRAHFANPHRQLEGNALGGLGQLLQYDGVLGALDRLYQTLVVSLRRSRQC